MQIGTRYVPFWEFACGELGKAAQDGEIDPVEATALVEAMPPVASVSRRRNGANTVDSCGKCGVLGTGRPGDSASGANNSRLSLTSIRL